MDFSLDIFVVAILVHCVVIFLRFDFFQVVLQVQKPSFIMTMFQYYKRSRHFVFFQHLLLLFFVLLCQNTAFARASSNGDLPTKADLQAQLDSLNKQKDLSAQDKLVQQDLTDTLATLDKIDRVKEETVQLRQKGC